MKYKECIMNKYGNPMFRFDNYDFLYIKWALRAHLSTEEFERLSEKDYALPRQRCIILEIMRKD